MPPEVRFADLVQLLDFIYYGEIRLATEDLNSFMALAEHLQIRGLTDNEKQQQQQFQQQQQQQKLLSKQLPKIPAAVQMVKRKGAVVQPSPGATLTSPGPSMGLKRRRTEPQYHQEMTSDDQHSMEFQDYQESEFGDPQYDDPHAVQSTSAGIQLTGLVCPHCRLVYHEVEALKNHIASVHRIQQQSNGKKQSLVKSC